MNPIAALLASRLPAGQVVDGFRTETWAVCDRVPPAVVFPAGAEEVAAVRSMARDGGWRVGPGGKGGP